MLFGPICFVYLYGLFIVSASPELYDWDVLLLSNDKGDLVQRVSSDHCMELLNDDMQYIVTVAWERFKKEFNKTYEDNQEHDRQFKLFCQRFMGVREHNKAYREGNVTFEKGINTFSDQGGHPPDAYNYVKEAGGVQLDSDYPYVAQQQTCQFDENKVVTKIVGFVEIPHSEQILQQAVALYGPIAVAVDALHLSWVDYKKGIISDPTCKNTRRDMNHAILLIGYGTDENGTPYWLIKNSQGTGWGEQGYGRILRNANNMCGIASYANYPLI
ncbi:cathepsin L [Clonorchis sinensis]|uniref:Cathepsin L n=1 Tax=Clonorchis sinensis TaxID=79923 RepID=H2KSQ6_CLOSI|nr:cathepsin L [Clonorchis sinensis]